MVATKLVLAVLNALVGGFQGGDYYPNVANIDYAAAIETQNQRPVCSK